MNMLLSILLIITWIASGISSYIYWHTKYYNLYTSMLFWVIPIGAFLGPMVWPIGWYLVGERPKWSKAIFKDKLLIPWRKDKDTI